MSCREEGVGNVSQAFNIESFRGGSEELLCDTAALFWSQMAICNRGCAKQPSNTALGRFQLSSWFAGTKRVDTPTSLLIIEI
ncbi:hypothetical protein K469DRAFT_704561 [Zopfia rhizophila CBS 207.26]|uniref:Uncharacterized protein n=1 Tax=Zopfia rhizophila CBS 207.26 TaxID=1314779 RepID=A0A6A6E6V0_9PEZI|nr:hypothetical protein K469DRAFT_704561 [Zopfia rhizophila CBS 207.26]